MVLTHLIERCPNNCHVFIHEGGPEIVVGVTQHLEGNTDIVNAANILLSQYIKEFTFVTRDFTPLATHIHNDKGKSDMGVAGPAETPLARLMRSGANLERIFSESMTMEGQVPRMGSSTMSRSISTKCTENVCSELNSLCELCEGNNCDKAEIQQSKGETSVISTNSSYSFKILNHLKSVCGKLFSNRNNFCAENLLGEKVNKTFNGESSNTSCEECRSCNNQQSFVYQNSVGAQTTPSISNKYKKFDAKFSNRSIFDSKKETSLMMTRKAVFSALNNSKRTEAYKAKNLASSSHGHTNYNTWQKNIGQNSTSTPLNLRTSSLATTPSKGYKDHFSCTPSTYSVCSDQLVCVRKFSEAELVNLFQGVELHGSNFRVRM
ncbi:hypothetical protein PR048_008009 [Dryococelus australis]|uniref:Uncharacterized protein n=1 Tax=Dryococelus australis TaxID=614101 RepID=A0ABQ9HXI9_9NEOP|nr:hypothetical protein PR048_008009 [Dryococelus australis]